jgi:hypothetical protein
MIYSRCCAPAHLEQRLRVPEVDGVKTLYEPAVDPTDIAPSTLQVGVTFP